MCGGERSRSGTRRPDSRAERPAERRSLNESPPPAAPPLKAGLSSRGSNVSRRTPDRRRSPSAPGTSGTPTIERCEKRVESRPANSDGRAQAIAAGKVETTFSSPWGNSCSARLTQDERNETFDLNEHVASLRFRSFKVDGDEHQMHIRKAPVDAAPTGTPAPACSANASFQLQTGGTAHIKAMDCNSFPTLIRRAMSLPERVGSTGSADALSGSTRQARIQNIDRTRARSPGPLGGRAELAGAIVMDRAFASTFSARSP